MTELRERVDFDHIQGRAEKVRDQLEDVLVNWRESFVQQSDEESTPAAPVAAEPTAKKPAAKTASKAYGTTLTTSEKNGAGPGMMPGPARVQESFSA